VLRMEEQDRSLLWRVSFMYDIFGAMHNVHDCVLDFLAVLWLTLPGLLPVFHRASKTVRDEAVAQLSSILATSGTVSSYPLYGRQ
jgi:hypothetical protein